MEGRAGLAALRRRARLSDEEVATIGRWSESGAAEGDPADLPPAPKFAEGWQLGEPDMVLKMAEPYALAAEGADEYRCFVIPIQSRPASTSGRSNTGPGNRKIVHHAVLTSLPHEQAAAKLAEGDGKSFLSGLAPPGRLLSGPLSIWTPGMEPRPLPDGLAVAGPRSGPGPPAPPPSQRQARGRAVGDRPPSHRPETDSRLQLNVFSNNEIDIAPGQGRLRGPRPRRR